MQWNQRHYISKSLHLYSSYKYHVFKLYWSAKAQTSCNAPACLEHSVSSANTAHIPLCTAWFFTVSPLHYQHFKFFLSPQQRRNKWLDGWMDGWMDGWWVGQQNPRLGFTDDLRCWNYFKACSQESAQNDRWNYGPQVLMNLYFFPSFK